MESKPPVENVDDTQENPPKLKKYHIDSGYIVPDPSDPHRFMLIAYIAKTDSVIIFRRAEMTEGDYSPDD